MKGLILIEMDNQWAGFGIDWYKTVKGIRLGWIGLHYCQCSLKEFIMAFNVNNAITKIE